MKVDGYTATSHRNRTYLILPVGAPPSTVPREVLDKLGSIKQTFTDVELFSHDNFPACDHYEAKSKIENSGWYSYTILTKATITPGVRR